LYYFLDLQKYYSDRLLSFSYFENKTFKKINNFNNKNKILLFELLILLLLLQLSKNWKSEYSKLIFALLLLSKLFVVDDVLKSKSHIF